MKVKASILIILVFICCKNKEPKPKFDYNQKANELIQQLVLEENCDCVLEIPKETI